MATLDQLHHLLAHTRPFSGLASAEQQQIASKLISKTYCPDDEILNYGQMDQAYLYLIVSGQVRMINKSSTKIVRIISSFDVFGHFVLLREDELPYRAEAVNKVELALLNVDDFKRIYQSHPRFAAFFDSDLRVYDRKHLSLHDVSGSQFLFGTRLQDLVQNNFSQCDAEITVQQAAQLMDELKTDYLVVMIHGKPIGLITDRIIRSEIVARGLSIEAPVRQVMKHELHIMSQRNSLFEALLTMLKNGLSHVLVNDPVSQKLTGVICNSDIARVQGYNPMLINQQIAQMQSVEALKQVRDEANLLLVQLYRRGVRAQNLITINTIINDSITGRVLELSRQALNRNQPNISFDWVWLSLGSEGRGEMSLKTDQDNALIYHTLEKKNVDKLQNWFSEWTLHVNHSLSVIGLKLCDGGMMACNLEWRIEDVDWFDHCNNWFSRSQAMDIMKVSAACDLRAVHGNLEMEKRIKNELNNALSSNPRFLKHMASAIISNRMPVNALTGRIRTTTTAQGKKLNLKRNCMQPITDFARLLCLQSGFLDSSNTFDRLEHLLQTQPEIKSVVSDALESYHHLNDIRLGHHLQAISTGGQVDNLITVNHLGETQYQMLKASLSSLKSIRAILAHRFNLM